MFSLICDTCHTGLIGAIIGLILCSIVLVGIPILLVLKVLALKKKIEDLEKSGDK